jgi:hypothetical protein
MDHQIVACRDHRLFSDPQTHGQRGVAVIRQALSVADGGQKEVQEHGIARQLRGEVAEKTSINPRKTLRRRAAHAVADQKMFLEHVAKPP